MKIDRTTKFYLHKRKTGETHNLTIRMRITLRGQRPLDFSTDHRVDLEDWDAQHQMVLPTSPNADEANSTITEWRAILKDIFARYELIEKRVPMPGEVKDLFNDTIGRKTILNERFPEPTKEFFEVFDLFCRDMGEQNQWTESTHEKFSSLRGHIREFDPYICFETINEKKMVEYLAYLNRKQLRNTTIAKNLGFFRWFLRWAADNGYYNGDVHEKFKPKLKGTNVESHQIIYCTQEELRKLEEHQFTAKEAALERVRDVFCFCCFTGLRYSDVAKLKRSDIKQGFIKVMTRKTDDGLMIELNRHSQSILDKYREQRFPSDLALPVISNEKMNQHLKVLGQVCGLDDPTRVIYFQGKKRFEDVVPKWSVLTTHCARRTFVVTALQLGIPAEVIMKWTGHSRYEAMKPYAAIVDELKKKSMSKFDEI